jgi:magnesium-transporting ATPase (P-type)
VSVKMLTGDALAVASEMARSVGLSNFRRVSELKAAPAAGRRGADLFAGANGFAEVYPEDKYIVVRDAPVERSPDGPGSPPRRG